MSCHYSQEQEEEFLEHTVCSDGNAEATSSGSHTAKKSSHSESKTAPSTKHQSSAISEHSSIKGTPDDIGEWLMSLVGDSPANPSVSQENSKLEKTNGTCGPLHSQWFAKYDRAMCSWRTSQGCLPGLTDISDEYSETWPKRGMMHDGQCYQLPTLAHPTEGTGSGCLLYGTPTAVSKARSQKFMGDGAVRLPNPAEFAAKNPGVYWPTATTDMVSMRTKKYAQGGTPLTMAVQKWPTPRRTDYKGANAPEGLTRADGKSRMDQLPNAVAHGGTSTRRTWPTPDANMPNRGTQENWVPQRDSGHHATYTINQSVRDSNGSGQLNPNWVEWLMGWPIGWTSLKAMPSDTVEQWKAQRDGLWVEDPADDPSSDVRRTGIRIEKRIDRLKAIGNGQVPLVAATAWDILSEGYCGT